MAKDPELESHRGRWVAQLIAWSKRQVGLDPRPSPLAASADALYAAAVGQARRPEFYLHLGVPDTPDARLELIQLHVILLLRRLQRGSEADQALGQALFDAFFLDLDRSLREGGVGDLSVGKWIKKLGQQFYARVAAVEGALEQDDEAALGRELEATLLTEAPSTEQLVSIARYVRVADRHLAAETAAGTPLAALRFAGIDPIEASQSLTTFPTAAPP